MEKKISVLPQYYLQKIFKDNHPLNKSFTTFYSTVNKRQYLIQQIGKKLIIKRVTNDVLLPSPIKLTFASGKIIQEHGTSKVDLNIRHQKYVNIIFNSICFILCIFIVSTIVATKKITGGLILLGLFSFLVAPWYMMLKKGIEEFKDDLEKDIDFFK